MTIISPNKNKDIIKFTALVLFILFFGGIFYIFEYNNLVDIRYEIQALKKKTVEFEAVNTDLKNALYQRLNFEDPQELVLNNNLTLEKKPKYIFSPSPFGGLRTSQ